MPPQIVKCVQCKLIHWDVYSCAEAGWHDEDGWNPRPLGVPFQVKHSPPVEHEVSVPVEHKPGRHALTKEELRKGGRNGAQTRMEVLSKQERHEIAKKAAQARWAKKKVDVTSPQT